ncbi:MAG: HAMP domain-containing histidine kinase [Sandaracinus sp.]|nr:HAMP domain-containing histidine kinase [Sandaracinus sp.]
MRLLPRLLLTQGIPLAVVTGAVVVVLLGAGAVAGLLSEMESGELRVLREETRLHRIGWLFDVSMRHAEKECRAAPTGNRRFERGELVRQRAEELRGALERARTADAELLRVLDAYVELVDTLRPDAPCALLGSATHEQRREQLDEDLTNAWVARIARLHEAVSNHEAEAQEVLRASLARGVALVAIALLLAIVVSWRLARSVSGSMAELAATARRLGRQEFRDPVPVLSGPQEVSELAIELESMRERLAEVDSLKRGFVSSVSHEMRTPLSKMREALALLSDGAGGTLTPRQNRLVTIARDACERQIRTVTALLDLSRLRAGAALRLEPRTSLAPIVERALAEERADAASRGVEVTQDFEPDVAGSFDSALVERALANLVRNAVGVSREGQTVHVSYTTHDEGPTSKRGRRWACVRVRDDGPGIPLELRDTLFQPFVSSAVPSSPKTLGVGLGLSLCREVAEAHGGRLEIGDRPRGAELLLWLPVDSEAAPPQTPTAPSAVEEARP